jgi:aryl-alcohol dehydrogenase-like predicted oxidoreductase
MPFAPDGVELGLGLLSIGRAWGVGAASVPTDSEATMLLETALARGIRIFDTAPAYAASERRLGAFLRTLSAPVRNRLVIMAKMGEHWDDAAGAPYVDHGRDALIRSIDRSLALLGRVDVLQLHKATEQVVDHPDVAAALDHAKRCGIACLGASVGTVEAGRAALRTQCFNCLQFPFNERNQELSPLLEALESTPTFPIINRPFAMGAAMAGAIDRKGAAIDAFGYLNRCMKRGIVLTGTGKPAHLAENIRNFRLAKSNSPDSSEA